MTHEKNANGLNWDNPVQTTPAGAVSGNPLKATDAVSLFSDREVKIALAISGVSEKSPLYHFLGLFEVAKSYICCNQEISEHIRENFDTLARSMDFYLDLVEMAHDDDLRK
ncbi:MAG: hypothetical protein LBR81_01240 [Prevotellaceae bacterium]|nr:hypothetical protein [Prevotellaceae bacterium]